jgi:hypothetical protein
MWCGRCRTLDGKLVRKRFGRDRQTAIAWVEAARTTRRTKPDDLAVSAKLRNAPKVRSLTPDSHEVTVGRPCDEFLKYLQSHPEEYRDQKNPPRRIEQVRKGFGECDARGVKSSLIEDWLDSLQEDREISNATINKLRGTFSALQARQA